jgi:FkbM family methyltransferase
VNESQLRDKILTYQGPTYSELRQDIMVCSVLDDVSQGFFVEFGVMDGIIASNSLLFERVHSWSGIIAEPGRRFHKLLSKNRRCRVDHRAVYSSSGGTLEFKEVDVHAGLSVLTDFMMADHHASRRHQSPGDTYQVQLVSLEDLLLQHDAPGTIEYVSMDTEGSESAILESFDFSKFDVKIWTVEHNFAVSARNHIHDIMTTNGYRRILTDLSNYDDWYVKQGLLEI